MVKPARKRAVAMVSGGLDSLVSLACADRELDVRLVLFFNYGQRSLERERAAVIDAAGYYGHPFREVDVAWLEDVAPAGMRRGAGADTPVGTLDEVWVPNRNGVFINAAAALAEGYGCDVVVTGFNREEAAEFPDNSAEYVTSVNAALGYSTRSGVEVISYTQDLTKREILRLGLERKAPLTLVWSCYRAGERMCGVCASCQKLRMAIDSLPDEDRPVIEFAAGSQRGEG